MTHPAGPTDSVEPPTIVLVLGGDEPSTLGAPPVVPPGCLLVAADSGLDAAVALGLVAHHVVGDLDSVDPALLAQAVHHGAEVHRHLADKDATDSELAIDLVVRLAAASTAREATGVDGPEPARLLVLGGGGGRLDHLLADLLVLASPMLAGLEVTARLGAATVTVVRAGGSRRILGPVGDQVSLLPLHGRARGVTTAGLRWPLVGADLVPGTTRAVSNELVANEACVALGHGVVLVVQPGSGAGPVDPRSTQYDPTPLDPTDTAMEP